MEKLRARLEELNPAPDRRDMVAQSLMQLGSGLMQSPTWQGGLGKGFDQMSQTFGDYGDDMRAYNQGQSATVQALFDTERARAEKYRENQFRDRSSQFQGALGIAGLEQRGRIADERLAQQADLRSMTNDYDLLISLQKQLAAAVEDSEKKDLGEKIVRVQSRIEMNRPGSTRRVLERGISR
jgi:hypothetical protein